MGVKVKKDTVNREAFEHSMDEIKNLVRQNAEPELIIQAINDTKNRLTEYIDEKEAELFRIPDWIHEI